MRFKGTAGSSYTGDMALDALSLTLRNASTEDLTAISVTCDFTAFTHVRNVYVDGVDRTRSVVGALSSWPVPAQNSFASRSVFVRSVFVRTPNAIGQSRVTLCLRGKGT